MTDKAKHPGGRPPKYTKATAQAARKLCELGATDRDLADAFDVAIATISNWKSAYPEFLEALKLGKDAADQRVEASLYQKATGYTFDAVKIFMPAGATKPVYAEYREHVAPDTTACIFWLKNRKPAEWREKVEHTGADGGPLVIQWLTAAKS